jgi:hypothetical protein
LAIVVFPLLFCRSDDIAHRRLQLSSYRDSQIAPIWRGSGGLCPICAEISARSAEMTKKHDKAMVGAVPAKQDAPPAVMALALPQAELSPEMQAYFAKCEEKLGYVPNVLLAFQALGLR